MTEAKDKVRSEFSAYFSDLRDSMKADGGNVNRYAEWAFFLQQKIDDGKLPAAASNWPCPRA